MTINDFKNKLKQTPEAIDFTETIELIEANYEFTPTAFINGNLENEAGTNSGSCKILAFAKNEALSKEETLACFGKFYFDEVLNHPNATNHQNIRNFIQTGIEGVQFNGDALKKK